MKDSEFMSQKASEMTAEELEAAIKIKQKNEKNEKRDTWNLADKVHRLNGKFGCYKDDIKTFIQIVKKDIRKQEDGIIALHTVDGIIDKRAGKL